METGKLDILVDFLPLEDRSSWVLYGQYEDDWQQLCCDD